MRKTAAFGAAGLVLAAVTPFPIGPAEGHGRDDAVVEQLAKVTRATAWESAGTIDLQFDAEHPQGLVKLGDRFFVSSVEIIEPTTPCPQGCDGFDRTPGQGVGHLFVVDATGALVADVELGEGHMYHPGGIDYDGRWLWVPVAEYRPNSNSIIYKVDPETLAVEEVFRSDDHIGGVVRDRVTGRLHGVSWGSRTLYEWTERGRVRASKPNPSHFIDYQDCDYLAYQKMVCGGIAGLRAPDGSSFELGGLALIDLRRGTTMHEVPVQQYSPTTNHVVTRNPVFLESIEGGLRLFSAPDDQADGAILIYTATV